MYSAVRAASKRASMVDEDSSWLIVWPDQARTLSKSPDADIRMSAILGFRSVSACSPGVSSSERIKLTYACRNPDALNFGRQIGSQLAVVPLIEGAAIVASSTCKSVG